MKYHYHIVLMAGVFSAIMLMATGNSRAGETADFYVAPNGNDANPGTAAAPFATIGAAQNAVRQMIAA
jgi:hypothetical protein